MHSCAMVKLKRSNKRKLPPTPSASYLSATLQNKPLPPTRKLLVLDLNGCLVFRTPHNSSPGHTHIERERAIYLRPYMPEFRSYLFHPSTRQWLDTMVWSSAQSRNVQKMVNVCFPPGEHQLLAIWARDKMRLSAEAYHSKTQTIKDLQRIWSEIQLPQHAQTSTEIPMSYSLLNTVLVDDSADKTALQPYNHIIVEEFTEASNDNKMQSPDLTLIALVGILDALKQEGNVANWIRCGGLSDGLIVSQSSRPGRWFEGPGVKDKWVNRGRRVLAGVIPGFCC